MNRIRTFCISFVLLTALMSTLPALADERVTFADDGQRFAAFCERMRQTPDFIKDMERSAHSSCRRAGITRSTCMLAMRTSEPAAHQQHCAVLGEAIDFLDENKDNTLVTFCPYAEDALTAMQGFLRRTGCRT